MECIKEAKKLGLDIGNKYYAFEGDSYSHKGCYFNDDNTAYFGAGGSIKQMVEMARANEDSWDSSGKKSLTKRCLVALSFVQSITNSLHISVLAMEICR